MSTPSQVIDLTKTELYCPTCETHNVARNRDGVDICCEHCHSIITTLFSPDPPTGARTVSLFETAVNTLNEAFRCDPDAIRALLCNRVPCNQALVEHPTVQVTRVPRAGSYTVGARGLLNGVLEVLTGKRVAAMWSDDTDSEGARKFIGFCEYV